MVWKLFIQVVLLFGAVIASTTPTHAGGIARVIRSPARKDNAKRGVDFWSPLGDSPFGDQLPTKPPIGYQKLFGDAHTPFNVTCCFDLTYINIFRNSQ